MFQVKDLPPPPPGKTGFPWTEGTPTRTTDTLSITIVTPSYNQGSFLEETIRSVLLQGYAALEYIVIDGGSTDESPTILEKYSPFLADWVSEPDNGQTDAINKGLRRGKGDLMGWVNSDDLLLPGALQAIADFYAAYPNTKASCGFRHQIDGDSRLMFRWMRGLPKPQHLRYRNLICQETTFWRRQIWNEVGELDANLRFCMDYDYWQRIIAAGYGFEVVPHYIGGFRFHDDSKTSTLQDVYQTELAQVLARYTPAQGESEALHYINRWDHWRYALAKDLGHHTLFEDAQRAKRILEVLEWPLISHLILSLYALYRQAR